MQKDTASEFMMAFVQEYLDGKRSRLDFDLDFSHYLMKHYAKIDRENKLHVPLSSIPDHFSIC